MAVDSEPIKKKSKNNGSLAPVVYDYAKGIQFKLFFFIFVIFLFLSSDAFINRILYKFNGAVSGGNVTSIGTIIMGLMLVFFGIIIDVLIQNKYI